MKYTHSCEMEVLGQCVCTHRANGSRWAGWNTNQIVTSSLQAFVQDCLVLFEFQDKVSRPFVGPYLGTTVNMIKMKWLVKKCAVPNNPRVIT